MSIWDWIYGSGYMIFWIGGMIAIGGMIVGIFVAIYRFIKDKYSTSRPTELKCKECGHTWLLITHKDFDCCPECKTEYFFDENLYKRKPKSKISKLITKIIDWYQEHFTNWRGV